MWGTTGNVIFIPASIGILVKDLDNINHFTGKSGTCDMTNGEAITGTIFGKHDCSGHPESQDRLLMAARGIPPDVRIYKPVPATSGDLALVHDKAYIHLIEERVKACPAGRCCYLDSDTYITSHTYETALFASGSAMLAADRARDGVHCFALVRPPGHHSGKDYPKGFCIFNNTAIAAAHALKQCDRVAIVDWDVHHGNGTQDIFYDSDRVLYISLHQPHHFPGTGWPEETGDGAGKGYTVNIPIPAGSTMREYRNAFEKQIIPGIRRFSPDLIIISAGQDPLYDDPLGGMNLVPQDFGEMTALLCGCSEGGLALVLEGGYGPSHSEAISLIFQALKENNPEK
jgi:acetoin utilization deacetylase AcuC-like enzyme